MLDLILKKIKDNCISCNVRENKCDDCNFVVNGNGAYINIDGNYIRKHHLYFFIHNQELKFSFPPLPEVDFLGNKRCDRKEWLWVVHHEDGDYWNDNKWNLILCLNTEHRHFHNLESNPMSIVINVNKNSESNKKTHRRKVEDGTHHILHNHPLSTPDAIKKLKDTIKSKIENNNHIFKTNHPMKNEETKNKMVRNLKKTISKKIEDGSHLFVSDNPMLKTKKLTNLTNWLKSLKEGEYPISKDLSDTFNYREPWSLRTSIERIIERHNLLNVQLKHNNKSKFNRQWTIVVTQ